MLSVTNFSYQGEQRQVKETDDSHLRRWESPSRVACLCAHMWGSSEVPEGPGVARKTLSLGRSCLDSQSLVLHSS